MPIDKAHKKLLTKSEIVKLSDDFLAHTSTHTFAEWAAGKGFTVYDEEMIWNAAFRKLLSGG